MASHISREVIEIDSDDESEDSRMPNPPPPRGRPWMPQNPLIPKSPEPSLVDDDIQVIDRPDIFISSARKQKPPERSVRPSPHAQNGLSNGSLSLKRKRPDQRYRESIETLGSVKRTKVTSSTVVREPDHATLSKTTNRPITTGFTSINSIEGRSATKTVPKLSTPRGEQRPISPEFPDSTTSSQDLQSRKNQDTHQSGTRNPLVNGSKFDSGRSTTKVISESRSTWSQSDNPGSLLRRRMSDTRPDGLSPAKKPSEKPPTRGIRSPARQVTSSTRTELPPKGTASILDWTSRSSPITNGQGLGLLDKTSLSRHSPHSPKPSQKLNSHAKRLLHARSSQDRIDPVRANRVEQSPEDHNIDKAYTSAPQNGFKRGPALATKIPLSVNARRSTSREPATPKAIFAPINGAAAPQVQQDETTPVDVPNTMVTTPKSDTNPPPIYQDGSKVSQSDAPAAKQNKHETETLQVRTPVSSRSTTPRRAGLFTIDDDLDDDNIIKVNVESLNNVESILGDYVDEFAGDQVYSTKMNLQKARYFRQATGDELVKHPIFATRDFARPNGMAGVRRPSPFASMTPKHVPTGGKVDPSLCPLTIEVPDANGKKIKSMSEIGAPFITWTEIPTRVPAYTHCTAVKKNVAAPNEKTLHCYPYFGESVDDSVYEALSNRYDVDIKDRQRKLQQGQQARKIQSYVHDFLATIGSSEEAVLFYLLNPSTEGIDVKEREKSCKEDFDRSVVRWVRLFNLLEETKFTKKDLEVAAWACTAFLRRTGYSLWHVVRKCDIADAPSDEEDPPTPTLDKIQKLACRVCHQHDCPNHIDYMEQSDSEAEDEVASLLSVEAKDIDWPYPRNHKRRLTIPQPLEERPDSSDRITVGRPRSRDKTAYARILGQIQDKGHDKRNRFYPCYHPGYSCSDADADCKCHREGLLCEKACGCSDSCERKYTGCSCHAQGRRICYNDDRCQCHALRRECDADLCKGCKADVVLDPANRFDDDIRATCCQNVQMQLGIPKRTLLGRSSIHGFGVYAGEPIKKHDFIGEYKGEITLPEERVRRGDVYEIQKMSYLFMLTEDQEIDSHHVGNKMRFVNHAMESGKNGACNIRPNVVMCNMTPRIGMYALRDIMVGEELFFNYGEHYMQLLPGPSAKDGGSGVGGPSSLQRKGGKKKGIARRKKADLRDFAEPEYEEVDTGEGAKSKMVTPRYGATSGAAARFDDDGTATWDSPGARPVIKRKPGSASKSVPSAVRPGSSTPLRRTAFPAAAADDDEDDELGLETADGRLDAAAAAFTTAMGLDAGHEDEDEDTSPRKRRRTGDDSEFDPEYEDGTPRRRATRVGKRRSYNFGFEDDEDEDGGSVSASGRKKWVPPIMPDGRKKRGRPPKTFYDDEE